MTFFKSKSLKQDASKTVLQEPFRKKESKFCEKQASLYKTIITNISFLLANFLGFQFLLVQVIVGSAWQDTIPCERCV